MLHQAPDERIVSAALERWRKNVGEKPTLGAGFDNRRRISESLNDLGVEVVEGPFLDAQGQVRPEMARTDVLVSGGQQLDGAIYDQLSCRLILRPYVGYNDIDVPAASARGILVCNVPDAYSEEVAMQGLAFLMAANRQLYAFEREARAGRWRERMGVPPLIIHNSRAQTVGVIGFGRIGRIAATRAQALGFRVIANDPYVKPDEVAELGIPLVTLDELLGEADYVLVHAFLWEETYHLLNAERLAKLKPGAWVINTARGPIIDEAALIEALRSGHLGGAGLDVFEVEPIEADNPLLSMPNVMISPHSAVYSEEGQVRAAQRTIGIARAALVRHLPDRVTAIDKGLYDALAAAGVPVHADLAHV
jgi:D-3-phosphoglycerate dehydrogenase